MTENSAKSSQVGKSEPVQRYPLVYLSSIAIIISFFAMIFLPINPFAVWWHGGLPGEAHTDVVVEFKLEFTSPSWFSMVTLFLFLAFLLCLVMSILLLLYSLGKISLRIPSNKLGFIGFIPSYAALTLTVTLAVVFIQYSSNRPWHLSFCFYSSLICATLLMLLFILQLNKESVFRRSALVTQAGF